MNVRTNGKKKKKKKGRDTREGHMRAEETTEQMTERTEGTPRQVIDQWDTRTDRIDRTPLTRTDHRPVGTPGLMTKSTDRTQ